MAINFENIIKKEYAEGQPGHVKDAKYFYFENSRQNKSELAILCGGYEQCAVDFRIDRKKFPFFAILFVCNGKGIFEINDVVYPISYGSLMAFSPGRKYKFAADSKFPMEQMFVLFDGDIAQELLDKSGLERKGAIKVSDPQLISAVFKQIIRIALNNTENAHSICCHYLKAIFLEQAEEKLNSLFIENVTFENYQRCKNYLEDNYVNIHSAKQLADQCHLNIRYIARLFRNYGNTRPYESLMNLKLSKAANLLLTSNLNINEISVMAGIDDAYHFSRIFKKKFNISPTQYRKHFGIH